MKSNKGEVRVQFLLNEQQLRNLNVFFTKIIFHGNDAQVIPEVNALNELRRIFDLSVLQRKDEPPEDKDNKKEK